jgi:hypothetical protein
MMQEHQHQQSAASSEGTGSAAIIYERCSGDHQAAHYHLTAGSRQADML